MFGYGLAVTAANTVKKRALFFDQLFLAGPIPKEAVAPGDNFTLR